MDNDSKDALVATAEEIIDGRDALIERLQALLREGLECCIYEGGTSNLWDWQVKVESVLGTADKRRGRARCLSSWHIEKNENGWRDIYFKRPRASGGESHAKTQTRTGDV